MGRRLERPREQLLAEAMKAIAEHGLAGLTMAGLARRLHTSGGHVLYYFRNKDHLLLETLRWSETQLTELWQAARARERTARGKLDRFVDLYLPSSQGDPRWILWLEVWSRSLADEDILEGHKSLDQAWHEDLTALLEEGQNAGEFRTTEPTRFATRLMAMLDGLSTQVLLGASRQDALDHVNEHLAETLNQQAYPLT